MAVSFKPAKDPAPMPMAHTSFNMQHSKEWGIATDAIKDIVVKISGSYFSLHKFPLVLRSGRFQKLVAEAKGLDLPWIEFPNFPGGAEGFKLATKLCYGINFDITTLNVAMLRCAVEYLEMTDNYGKKNLVARTEIFLSELEAHTLSKIVALLHSCENLLPLAEELKIVSRCIDAIASKLFKGKLITKLSSSGDGSYGHMDEELNKHSSRDSWTEELSVLRLDFYQRVVAALRFKGVCYESIWETLSHYAQCSMKVFNKRHVGSKAGMQAKVHEPSTALEQEQIILLETIVSLLPPDMNTKFYSFLFSLLYTAHILNTTVACKIDLERRIGMQLEQANLDDLLIPSFPYNDNPQFDVDLVHRLVVNFLQHHQHEDFQASKETRKYSNICSPSYTTMLKIGRLVDSYLAEVALDINLKLDKFLALAELLPDYARLVDDSLHRAIDIYLKAHPSLNEPDRKKLCKLMDVQKLSEEACIHAAQNERLHAQFMIQVLYFEQTRLRSALANKSMFETEYASQLSSRVISDQLSASSPHTTLLHQENRELKHEISRLRMMLSNFERKQVFVQQDIEKSTDVAGNKFLQTITKKLRKLNPFVCNSAKNKKAFDSTNARRRWHSIS